MKSAVTNILLCLFFVFIIGFAFAQSIEDMAQDISEIKADVQEIKSNQVNLIEQLTMLNGKMINFMNSYGDALAQQNQAMRAFIAGAVDELIGVVTLRTDPMFILAPNIIAWVAILSFMAFLYGVIKSRDLLLKFWNRNNILCTCGTYAKSNKEKTEYNCGRCGKHYYLTQSQPQQETKKEEIKEEPKV